MKLDKAIELSKDAEDSLRSHKFIDHADAVKLGTEALKRLERSRNHGAIRVAVLLPGEDPPELNPIPIETLVKIRESPLGKEPKG